MIPVKQIDPDDLVLYAMQLLAPEDTGEISLHLQHSADARKTLSEIYGDLSILACTADMHSPPALTRQRLMKHVAREKKAVPMHLVEKPAQATSASGAGAAPGVLPMRAPRSTAARILPWAGWAMAAGLALEAGNLSLQDQHLRTTLAADRTQLSQTQISAETASLIMETVKDPSAVRVALTSTGTPPPPEGRASYVPEKGSLVFIASNLAPLQAYKTYELWLIPADGRDPIAAGTFHPDLRGNASVLLPHLPPGVQAKAFGVTIEDGEGATQPTMPIILKGVAS